MEYKRLISLLSDVAVPYDAKPSEDELSIATAALLDYVRKLEAERDELREFVREKCGPTWDGLDDYGRESCFACDSPKTCSLTIPHAPNCLWLRVAKSPEE